MTPEIAICAALERIAAPFDGVFPAEALQNAGERFIFYRRLSADEEDDLSGGTGLLETVIEVNCVAPTYGELQRISGAAKSLLQDMQGRQYENLLIERVHVRQASPDLREKEVGLYRRVYALTINYQED